MHEQEARHVLEDVAASLKAGYAKDLINSFLDVREDDDSEGPDGDAAGDLFRALVLDEHLDVYAAEVAYRAAYALAE